LRQSRSEVVDSSIRNSKHRGGGDRALARECALTFSFNEERDFAVPDKTTIYTSDRLDRSQIFGASKESHANLSNFRHADASDHWRSSLCLAVPTRHKAGLREERLLRNAAGLQRPGEKRLKDEHGQGRDRSEIGHGLKGAVPEKRRSASWPKSLRGGIRSHSR
jgi:hypothetical protein